MSADSLIPDKNVSKPLVCFKHVTIRYCGQLFSSDFNCVISQ